MLLPTFSQWTLLLAYLLSLPAVQAVDNRTCYYPDGTVSNGSPFEPNSPASPCCGPGFICLSNGLCSPGPDTQKAYQFSLYRSACTDKTWNSTGCPRICIGGNDDLKSGQGVVDCGNGAYCCGHPKDCCQTPSSIFQLPAPTTVTIIPYVAEATGAATSSAGTSITTSTTRPQPNKPSKHSSGLSAGAKAGIGVAAALAGLAIIGAMAWLRLRRRRSRQKEQNWDKSELSTTSPPPKVEQFPAEMPNGTSRQEMPESQRHEKDVYYPTELPNDQYVSELSSTDYQREKSPVYELSPETEGAYSTTKSLVGDQLKS